MNREASSIVRSALAVGFAVALVAIPASAAVKSALGKGYVPSVVECGLLDDPKAAGKMDGLLRTLAIACDRPEFLGGVEGDGSEGNHDFAPVAVDVLINDPSDDTPHGPTASRTQSETTIAASETTGTLCSAFNDAYHGVIQGDGFSGFSRSTDGGLTWDDRGALSTTDSGDPSLVWRKADGKFYYASLAGNGGLSVFRSDDDCMTFTPLAAQPATGSDDKEIMAVDNNPASPYYGHLYIVWTDFGQGARIFAVRSTNAGVSWSAQVALSAVNDDVQGAWPTVAPNGDVFVGWVRWNPWPAGPIDAQISRSTDGGVTWALTAMPMSGQTNPRDSAATGSCGRPALGGNIRYLPNPTIIADSSGNLHAVYSYDPDAFNVGDESNIYYRKSTDSGTTWASEILINDDGTTRDQWQPSMSVGVGNVVSIGYYSRQLDAGNLLFDYYARVSYDGGATFQPSVRLTDASSPVVLDSSLATCYHGDYDTQIQVPGKAHLVWSDDRDPAGDAPGTPNIYTESVPAGTDYLLVPSVASRTICAGAVTNYPIDNFQFQGFSESVDLSVSGNPAPSGAGFTVDPVPTPGSTVLNITNTGGVPLGTYPITISGDSIPGGIDHSTQVSLTVFPDDPAAPALTAPADGAINQPLRPVFTWSSPPQGAETYLIEVDDDINFGSVNFSATVNVPTATPGSDLASNTQFFWRVSASNACGPGALSVVRTFTTVPAPGDCGGGSLANVSYQISFEPSGLAPGWVASGTGNPWQSSTAQSHSPTHSWWSDDPVNVTDKRLTSPPFALPAGESPISFIYWNYQSFEDNPPGCYDGGILEISTDGVTFTQVPNSLLLTDPYTGTVSTCCSNPLGGLLAWCGDPEPWTRSVVDLSAYAGQTVNLRFRLATDSSVSRQGWWIDDVSMQTCSTTLLFRSSWETGDQSEWDAVVIEP